MIYEVILHPTAEMDLDEIFKYYEGLREGLGFEFMLSFDSCMNSLATNPTAYFNINNQSDESLFRDFLMLLSFP